MNKLLTRQLGWFCLIGTCAAIIHLLTVIILVELITLKPLIANIGGFITSFNISYWGHRYRTFAGTTTKHHLAMPRLFLLSSLIFITNEYLFYLSLKYTHLPYVIALLSIIIFLAAITFLLSKVWVFGQR